jgi:hypothetical protein
MRRGMEQKIKIKKFRAALDFLFLQRRIQNLWSYTSNKRLNVDLTKKTDYSTSSFNVPHARYLAQPFITTHHIRDDE